MFHSFCCRNACSIHEFASNGQICSELQNIRWWRKRRKMAKRLIHARQAKATHTQTHTRTERAPHTYFMTRFEIVELCARTLKLIVSLKILFLVSFSQCHACHTTYTHNINIFNAFSSFLFFVHHSEQIYLGSWTAGRILCEIWISLDILLCTASILSLCAISLDR